jgi:hypothetical protein
VHSRRHVKSCDMVHVPCINYYAIYKKCIKACKVGLQRSSKYHDRTNQNIDLNKCHKVQEIQICALQVEFDSRNINLKPLGYRNKWQEHSNAITQLVNNFQLHIKICYKHRDFGGKY